MFECLNKCAKCCGIVLIPKEMALRTQDKAQVKPVKIIRDKENLYILTEDCLCVYLNRRTRKCAIYDDRPEICRRYGTDFKLPCPYLEADGTIRGRMSKIKAEIQMNSLIIRAEQIVKEKQKDLNI